MKKLLYTTTAFVLCGGIVQTNAACIATPSCTAMGYTSSSSCTNGIKCPFGEYWNCANSDLSNKITELEKKIENLETPKEACYIGSILYSDKSCSSNLILGKTPIGIVIYIDGTGGGQALALKSIGSYTWGGYGTNISALPDYTSSSAAATSQDVASCENSAKIRAQGDSSKYPAAWAAYEYETEGTKAGDWCLPAAGIFASYYNNQTVINLGFDKVGGTKFTPSTTAWSSSETDDDRAWNSNFNFSYGLGLSYKNVSNEVRPVLEFPVEEKTACDSSYQYTCTGTNESPSGEACDGKYTTCTCSSPYTWDSSNGTCKCNAFLSCTGEHETGGKGASCNGKYTACTCETDYWWNGAAANIGNCVYYNGEGGEPGFES